MFHEFSTAFLPSDVGILPPVAGILDSIVLDFTIRDLAFWFKIMTWSEFGWAVTAFLAIKIVCDRIEARVLGLVLPHVKRLVATRYPRLGQRFDQAAVRA